MYVDGFDKNTKGVYVGELGHDAMGTTSLAYVLRADIDLSQMESAEEEPTSNVKNGAFWIDEKNSIPAHDSFDDCYNVCTDARQGQASETHQRQDGPPA